MIPTNFSVTLFFPFSFFFFVFFELSIIIIGKLNHFVDVVCAKNRCAGNRLGLGQVSRSKQGEEAKVICSADEPDD